MADEVKPKPEPLARAVRTLVVVVVLQTVALFIIAGLGLWFVQNQQERDRGQDTAQIEANTEQGRRTCEVVNIARERVLEVADPEPRLRRYIENTWPVQDCGR